MRVTTDMRDQNRRERFRLSRSIAAVACLALLAGVLLSFASTTLAAFALLGMGLLIVVALRGYALLATFVLAVRILVDYYGIVPLPSYFPFVGVLLALGLLLYLFLIQSKAQPWAGLRYWWLWAAFLALTLPGIALSVDRVDAVGYYFNTICSAAIFWALGLQLSPTLASLRRVFDLVVAFGTVIALQAIIAAWSGVFLFATPQLAAYVVSKHNLQLGGADTTRIGGFLLNPDTMGIFISVIGLLALGLLFSAHSIQSRVIYAIAALLSFATLFLTYSTAAWLAVAAGLIALLVLLGNWRYIVGVFALAFVGTGALLVLSPSKVGAFVSHASAASQFSLRLGVWETAISIIRAFPLMGLGLGTNNYLARSYHYQSALQTVPEVHPHNSFLEVAAMSGMPALLLFFGLLGGALWALWINYRLAAARGAALLAGAIAAFVAVSVNSLGSAAWTSQPIVALIWLVVGAATSPALAASLRARTTLSQAAPADGDQLRSRAAPASENTRTGEVVGR